MSNFAGLVACRFFIGFFQGAPATQPTDRFMVDPTILLQVAWFPECPSTWRLSIPDACYKFGMASFDDWGTISDPIFAGSIAIMHSALAAASAFSGLLSAAIIHMDGIGHKSGWAWIFILVGLLVVHLR